MDHPQVSFFGQTKILNFTEYIGRQHRGLRLAHSSIHKVLEVKVGLSQGFFA